MVPPLERLERREEPEAKGGEFVEADVAKRTKQISPMKKEAPHHSELSLVQLPLFDLRSVPVDKGSDTYPTPYKLNLRIYR